jgi:hypothetical protein
MIHSFIPRFAIGPPDKMLHKVMIKERGEKMKMKMNWMIIPAASAWPMAALW